MSQVDALEEASTSIPSSVGINRLVQLINTVTHCGAYAAQALYFLQNLFLIVPAKPFRLPSR